MSYFAHSALHALNHTELYQTCREAGIIAHPRATREELISYLLGEAESPIFTEDNHPIHRFRIAVIGFLNEYWATLAPQVKCPAKTLRDPVNPTPRPCFGCVDTQVIACLVENSSSTEKLISIHLPRGTR
jgi:hypothetical protein